ncbi:hypothetical protein GQ42DRAFT_162754 [Ramicandelaber brevisporus]|nr:hypothetical protein GQ42DRAFT_162754 [Ramicandelaber brevisporus]
MNINSEKLRIIVTGDSAGGCLTVSLTSRIIEHNMSATESKNTVMEPVAIVPVYPSLDFNGGIVVNPRDYKYFGTSSDSTSAHGAAIMSSYSARFDDRMISAPMTDVVSVIYGSSALHNVKNEYRLAPLHTPDTILEKWTIPSLFLVGELDIFVDHSVIFSGKLREAQRRARSRQATDQEVVHCSVSDADTQTVVLSGISHGFLSLSSVYPEAFAIIEFIGRYMADAFHNASEIDSQVKMSMAAPSVNNREEVLAKLDLVQDNLLIKRKMHFDAVINN